MTVSSKTRGDPRQRATAKFLEFLADDFETNGREAVERAREKDPIGYLRAIAALLPKDMSIEKPLDGLSDHELAAVIGAIRELRAAFETRTESRPEQRTGKRTARRASSAARSASDRSGAARKGAGGAGIGADAPGEPQPIGGLPALS